ncbi:hypothetical protein LNP04_02670 [Chryseobacterium sp. C-71]|uniref:hypothetical protein n=1 Tax=Chryseobacterium sp. C-71 TaxID=2893882 RepID=UPI001E54380B|nr:hypothetical protein [Chryseobacterium sp. C-71]UFH32636.1 hypothetical protein LNP04_02670 [Chryseobacterium sp. C-71]
MEENKLNQIIKSEEFALASDIAEISLDSFTDDGIIKDVPIIGTIIKLLNIGNTISDRIFTDKLIHFLKEIDNLDQEFILKEIRYIDDSGNHTRKVGEKILEIINRIDSDGKPQIIGRLFRNFINKQFSYFDFLKLADIVEKSFYYDLILLKESKDGKFYIPLEEELFNFGLLKENGIGIFNATDEEREEFKKITYLLSTRGSLLLEYGLK